jgi:hypothetical protein
VTEDVLERPAENKSGVIESVISARILFCGEGFLADFLVAFPAVAGAPLSPAAAQFSGSLAKRPFDEEGRAM